MDTLLQFVLEHTNMFGALRHDQNVVTLAVGIQDVRDEEQVAPCVRRQQPKRGLDPVRTSGETASGVLGKIASRL